MVDGLISTKTLSSRCEPLCTCAWSSGSLRAYEGGSGGLRLQFARLLHLELSDLGQDVTEVHNAKKVSGRDVVRECPGRSSPGKVRRERNAPSQLMLARLGRLKVRKLFVPTGKVGRIHHDQIAKSGSILRGE